ncbi:uncharacterized protein LOC120326340 [Styela clava]
MVLRSAYPDVVIPNLSFSDYMLKAMNDKRDKIAIVDAPTGRELTFGDVVDGVIKCASALNKRGLKKGDVMATCASNSPEYLIAIIAAAACGAVTTTCNPRYTAGEIEHQFKNSEPKIVFTIPDNVEKIKEVAKSVKSIKEIYSIGEADSVETYSSMMKEEKGEAFPRPKIDPEEDLVLLPYSSGTTGLPKGVMITHRNIVACLTVARMTHMYPTDCKYTPLPLFHLLGLISAYSALDDGIKHVLEVRFDLQRMFADIEKHKVTIAVAVPPVILAIVHSPLIDKYDLSSLREIYSGAAPLSRKIAEALTKKIGCKVTQAWGMTEAAPICHHNALVTPIESVGEIGVNTKVKILDVGTGQEVGVNQDGEICLKGPQVMKGYYKNPAATSATIDTDGWLHTGDIGHYDENGMIYIIDRLKELIKYKGFQVVPAEIESVLHGHPLITDAAVAGIPDEECGELARGFIMRKDQSLTEKEIHEFMKDKLAKYKQLHGGIEFCDSIPKSPTGKIMRRTLRQKAVEANS